MPDHVHGTIQILGRGGFLNPPLRLGHDLSEIIRGFKTWSSRMINQSLGTIGQRFWQRSFYDHIIRNEQDLAAIRNYIDNNALKWEHDRFLPHTK
jgi:REP element-mobilizing transposase RayT